MSFTPETIILIIYFLWSLILTIILLRFYLYNARLLKDGKKQSIDSLLNEILKKEKEYERQIQELYSKILELEKDGLLHIQKVGLLRFNPFKETGGDQSFILAFVDAEDTGVVISSLHTRTGTRWYAKKVVKGKGVEHDLSKEEERALREARFLNEK